MAMSNFGFRAHQPKDVFEAVGAKGDRLCALLYVDTLPRLSTYTALADGLREAGHMPILLLRNELHGLGVEDAVGEQTGAFFIAPENIRTVLGADAYFSQEQAAGFAPPDVPTVAIMHSLPDLGLKSEGLTHGARHSLLRCPIMVRTVDYFAIAVRQTDQQWSADRYKPVDRLYPPQFLVHRRPVLDIVPAGYPKLDKWSAKAGEAQLLDCIIYSPTAVDSGQSRIREDGETVIRILLEHFPDYRIVLRPYPSRGDREIGKALAAVFQQDSHFHLDEFTTGSDLRDRCAISVTDSSSSSISFALMHKRPLIFVELTEGSSDAKLNPLGFTVRGRQSLIDAVQRGIAEADVWRSNIEAACHTYLYNFGSASRYLAESLPVFARRESRADWLSVPRRAWRGGADPKEIQRHLARVRSWTALGRPTRWTEQMQTEIIDYLTALPARKLAAPTTEMTGG